MATKLMLPPFLIKNPVAVFLLHYIIWELLYMLIGLPIVLATPAPNWENFFFNYGLLGSVNFLLFYLAAFFLIPAFLIQKKRIALLVFICIFVALLFTWLKYRIEVWHFRMLLEKVRTVTAQGRYIPASPLSPVEPGSYFRNYVWFTFIIIIIAFAYQLLLLWYWQEKQRKDIQNQMLQAELSFLKMQVNPHFLFNALNNLYSMAVLERSSKTGDGILKLSELIRYMLYEKEDEQQRVSLDKEIRHINSYIDLQKLRFDGGVYIKFSIEGQISDKRIPSLLLFPLIENSCKHGILNDAEKPVNIHLKVSDHQLNFNIHNFKSNFLKDETSGIGLVNVRKRLFLLYNNSHTLNIRETEYDFLVELQLPL